MTRRHALLRIWLWLWLWDTRGARRFPENPFATDIPRVRPIRRAAAETGRLAAFAP